MKKIAILQSNYIPWKGYFDIINMVDEFILYDDVQFTKRDWRNRNKIQTEQGIKWLTIPIKHEHLHQKIKDTKISDSRWAKKHFRTISQNYSKAKYYNEYKDIFEELYLNCKEEYLSEINYKFILEINKVLNIKTKISYSSELNLDGNKMEKLVKICKESGADSYLSGPSAKNYLDESLMQKENIKVEWIDYKNYKNYTQLHLPFSHEVSIIDLLFNEGKNAKNYMNSFRMEVI